MRNKLNALFNEKLKNMLETLDLNSNNRYYTPKIRINLIEKDKKTYHGKIIWAYEIYVSD